MTMFRKAVDTILSFAFSRFRSSPMDLSSFTAEAERTHDGVPEQAPSTTKTSAASRSNLLYYLQSLGKENASYYQGHLSASSDLDEGFTEVVVVLKQMCIHIPEVEQCAARLAETAPLFDFPGVEGNGYRSLLQITDACVLKLLEANVYMRNNREKFHFRIQSSLMDMKNYVEVLGTLRAMLKYAERMIDVEVAAGTHDLFPGNSSDTDNSELLEDWLLRIETLNQKCFFGSCTAFHLCASIRAALHTITTALATFAEKYQALESENPGTGPQALNYLVSNLLASRKFIMDPELKADQLVTSTRELDITFCKAFWSVSESRFFEPVHWWLLPKADLNREILIEPESFTLPKIALREGEMEEEVFIKPPSAHIGERPLMARLMSSHIREGQLFIDVNDSVKSYKLPGRVLPKSDYLLFHAHGGGFVAQSSKACDLYLREWAHELQVPILSVDYTLAPEGPYPRAVEETFYAYCWALRYAHKLGWTGKKIVLVGDSAGGNLVFGVAFQAFMQSVRMPDGILALYAPFLTRYTPSPSRIISLMDPLIPIGILTRCLAAYAGLPEHVVVEDAVTEAREPTGSDDSSPSVESQASWDQMSTSELKGVEEMTSIPPSASEDQLRLQFNDEETVHREETRTNQNRFPFTIPSTQDILSFANPVTSRVSHGIQRATNAANSSYSFVADTAESLLQSKSVPTRQRSNSVVNPNAPWTKMATPLKRYNFDKLAQNDPLLSPLQADERMLRALPPVCLIATHLDPFLDDSVEMAKALKKVDHPVQLDLLSNLPHGFLNFLLVSEEARQGNSLAIQRLRSLFGLNDTVLH